MLRRCEGLWKILVVAVTQSSSVINKPHECNRIRHPQADGPAAGAHAVRSHSEPTQFRTEAEECIPTENLPARMKSLQGRIPQPGVAGIVVYCDVSSALHLTLKKPVCSPEKLTRHVSTLQKMPVIPYMALYQSYESFNLFEWPLFVPLRMYVEARLHL